MVATMCNLSYGLIEEGMEKGIQQEHENMVLSMLQDKRKGPAPKMGAGPF